MYVCMYVCTYVRITTGILLARVNDIYLSIAAIRSGLPTVLRDLVCVNLSLSAATVVFPC
jgi:hypothetical protein